MKRSAKNYLTVCVGLLMIYFLCLAILAGSEEQNAFLRLHPGQTSEISLWWYIAMGLCGAVALLCLAWMIVSKRNQLTFAQVMARHLDLAAVVISPVLGAVAAVAVGINAIGSLPQMHMPSFSNNTNPVADVSASESAQNTTEASLQEAPSTEVSQAPIENNQDISLETSQSIADESHYIPPIPELPPLWPSTNLITKAQGVQTISDIQTLDGNYSSSQPDFSCLLAKDAAQITTDHAVFNKTGSVSDGALASKYGINAAVLAADSASVNMLSSIVTANGDGADGVAVNGMNATASVNNCDVTVKGINSSAYFAAFQGQMRVSGGNGISTTDSSPLFAPRSTASIQADMVNCQTNGSLSPIVRASGAFAATNLNANTVLSSFGQIEPGGSITMSESKFTVGAIQSDTGHQGVFIFDNQEDTQKQEPGHLSLTGNEWMINPASAAAPSAFSFVVNGASAQIDLTSNTIYQVPQCAQVTNGKMTINCTSQALSGPVLVDEASSFELNLTSSSSFNGHINQDRSSQNVIVHLDGTSRLILTGDCYLSEFSNDDPSNANITTNGFHIYVGGNMLI
ncbi:hypothetical protein [Allobaculum sp. JKK-2023]|uniref:hypothetical protein n=1 Tax=Allobaculum sp. JKK-2023 TaxID=3108943 RepID=UPI002B0572A5|nr:hypothetical protein [Allobaculum sp. JKK-2023]